MQIETVPLSKLNPAAYNPRKDLKPSDPEYDKLRKSLKEFGTVDPIVWNKRTGNVVGGHQRLKVLKAEGVKETQVSVVDLPLAKEQALNLALNKISGEWDFGLLQKVLLEIDTSALDIEATGFDVLEFGALRLDLPMLGLEEDAKWGQSYYDNVAKHTAFFALGKIAAKVDYELLKAVEAKLEAAAGNFPTLTDMLNSVLECIRDNWE